MSAPSREQEIWRTQVDPGWVVLFSSDLLLPGGAIGHVRPLSGTGDLVHMQPEFGAGRTVGL
jgi:hypothetical protein